MSGGAGKEPSGDAIRCVEPYARNTRMVPCGAAATAKGFERSSKLRVRALAIDHNGPVLQRGAAASISDIGLLVLKNVFEIGDALRGRTCVARTKPSVEGPGDHTRFQLALKSA